MLHKLTESEYKDEYRIWLKFADATEGEVDFQNELWGEIVRIIEEQGSVCKIFHPQRTGNHRLAERRRFCAGVSLPKITSRLFASVENKN